MADGDRPLRTRFAPSPTGDLHLGGAWTALASWALARSTAGSTVLRVEDIDTPRVVRGSRERIIEDLERLGFDWDEGPILQSERTSIYEEALEALGQRGLTYPCDCSRAEIARAASAPHAGEEAIYPGTCRDADPGREMKRAPAIRLSVPRDSSARVSFVDGLCGAVEQDVSLAVSDFVLRRGDGVFAYQLVVAVDDAEMGITDVVRADDLLGSTARQILLMRLLGIPEARLPRYTHIPLVLASDGERLAKRAKGTTIRELFERGVSAQRILGALAFGLGLTMDDAPRTPREIAAELAPISAWRRTWWRAPNFE